MIYYQYVKKVLYIAFYVEGRFLFRKIDLIYSCYIKIIVDSKGRDDCKKDGMVWCHGHMEIIDVGRLTESTF